MKSNRDHTVNIFNQHKGELVLIDDKVMQLIGIMEDENDYCYIAYNGIEIKYYTILSSLIQLKGKIEDDAYNRTLVSAKNNFMSLDSFWGYNSKYNGSLTHRNELINNHIKKYKSVELMDDLHWDLV